MTPVTSLVHEATRVLADAGLASPLTDARLLLAHVTGTNPGLLFLLDEVDDEAAEEFRAIVRRRAAHVPLQHITGVAHFRHETVSVGPGVFVPRPETELLVELCLPFLAERPPSSRRVVELCAGSGAVSRSIAREIGGVEVHAVELSPDALPWLRLNTADIAVRVVEGDMATALPELDGKVDVVVVNPPYVPERLRGTLPVDVEGHDPDLALFSGPDGLDAIRVLARAAARLLVDGGLLVTEHDDSHGPQVTEILRHGAFGSVTQHLDLTGRDRAVTAIRRARGRM